MSKEPAKALTIAGSDSGGAAGLQADLRTFAALGVYGLSVVTVVTAQNSVRVNGVHPLPAEFVAAQLDAVLSDYGETGDGIAAVKTGFAGRVDLIQIIAARLQAYRVPNIVVDPVLVNHHGQPMFAAEVAHSYLTHLLPLADLVTPNRHEAALLTNGALPGQTGLSWLERTAERLHGKGARHVLVKGGRDGADVVDVLFDGTTMHYLRTPWLDTANTHGSGDTLSAAVCAWLAQGTEMVKAVQKAQQFTAVAIQEGAGWQLGRGHGPVAQWLAPRE